MSAQYGSQASVNELIYLYPEITKIVMKGYNLQQMFIH